VVVADTSAMIALLDEGDRHHKAVKSVYLESRHAWVLPWAILPEVDYLVAATLEPDAQPTWLDDLVTGAYSVEWGRDDDLAVAQTLARKYAALRMGLVDGVVMAVAERLRADIATLDLRHFGAVTLRHAPRLLPRDAARRG
jgi:predicted nucleic acid-binding protein